MFYRAKVLNNIDDQLDGRVLVYVHKVLKEVWASPAREFSKAPKDEAAYGIHAGEYNTPRIDSYITVFLIDDSEWYYLPWSLNYAGQTPKGMNLLSLTKMNFLNAITRTNIRFKEYFNGAIVGCDLNDETNTFFLIFDNGAKVELSSPIEPNKTGGKRSHSTISTLFHFLANRIDSLYHSSFKLSTTQTESRSQLSSSVKSTALTSDLSNYKNDEAPETLNEASIETLVNKESGSFNVKVNTNSTAIEKSSTYNEGVLSNKDGIKANSTFVSLNEVDGKKSSLQIDRILNPLGLKLIKDITYYLKDKAITIKKIVSELLEEKSYSETTMTSYTDKNVENNKAHINIVSNDKNRTSTTKKIESVEDDKSFVIESEDEVTLEGSLVKTKLIGNDKEFSSSVEVQSSVTDDETINAVTIKEDFVDKISFTSKLDRKNKISTTELINSYVQPNDTDPTGVLGLAPMIKRGHNVKIESSEDKSSFEITSIKDAFPTADAGMPKFGVINSIKFIEEGTEASVEINLLGINPAGGIKFKLSTDSNGVLSIELPGGNATLKAPLGAVNVECMNASIKASNTVKIESDVALETKTTTKKDEATSMTSISTSNKIDSKETTITGGMLKVKGSVTPDPEGGPLNAIIMCPYSGAPHAGSICSGT